MSLKQKTVSNIKWSFVESLSLKAIGFILGIILARLLTPADFGILAVVNVFYLLVTLFIDGGLKEALIQKKDATDIHYSTVFWLNILIGVFLYILLFIAAPYIQNFYDYKNLSFYIRLQSLTLIIESFGVVQIAKATKELNLKKITKARIPASLFSFGVGIFLAYNGFGILSLIIQQLVNTTLYIVLLLISIQYKPQFIFDFKAAKVLYRFGLKILGMSLISRFYSQALNLIYAKFYTPQLLGLNNKAGTIQATPIDIINSTFMKGIYPTMVVLQDNTEKLRGIYLTNIKLLTYVMLLLNGVFFFKANEIIKIVLGNNWMGSVVYLKIAAIGSLLGPIMIQSQNIFKVRNKLNIFLKIDLCYKVLTLILIFILVSFISMPRLLSYLVAINLFISFVYLYIASKTLQFSFVGEFFAIILKFLLFGFIGVMISDGLEYFISKEKLLLQLLMFAMLYILLGILLIVIMDRKITKQIINLFAKKPRP